MADGPSSGTFTVRQSMGRRVLKRHEVLAAVCSLMREPVSGQNCRNTRRIGEETALLSGFEAPPYRMGQVDGAPGGLSGLRRCRIAAQCSRKVLSQLATEPALNRRRGDSLKVPPGAIGGREVSRHQPSESDPLTYRFRRTDGYRHFASLPHRPLKAWRARSLLLCDVDRIDSEDDRSLLYVAMSRARSLLTVLLHVRTKAAVREAFEEGCQIYGGDVLSTEVRE